MTAVTLPLMFNRKVSAKLLGISWQTLDRLERKGMISAYRPSPRVVYYLETELAAFIERNSKCVENSTRDKSEISGQVVAKTRRSGAGHGTTPIVDRRDAKASALQTFAMCKMIIGK